MATFIRRPEKPKKKVPEPSYSRYRDEVQEDFRGYCAYCGVHENEWDHGEKNYCLDHFKPKGIPKFNHLRNDFYNLYWCCHICNRADAKGEQWPSPEEEAKGFGFVDLCEDDWQAHYRIQSDGKLESLSNKAKYTITAIGLNNKSYVDQRKRILAGGSSIFPPSNAPDVPQ